MEFVITFYVISFPEVYTTITKRVCNAINSGLQVVNLVVMA